MTVGKLKTHLECYDNGMDVIFEYHTAPQAAHQLSPQQMQNTTLHTTKHCNHCGTVHHLSLQLLRSNVQTIN